MGMPTASSALDGQVMTAPGPGWPANLRELVDWLDGLPPAERYRVAMLVGDQTLTRPMIALSRYSAVHTMAGEPGLTHEELGERLGCGRATVAKALFRWRQAVARGQCIVCDRPAPPEDMCDACASSVVLEPPDDGEEFFVSPPSP
jgi:hypothetical protein